MMELVTPTIRQGGVNTVFVMVRTENEEEKSEFLSDSLTQLTA